MLRGSLCVLSSLFAIMGSFVLISVVLSRCPYLWEPRLFRVHLAFVMPFLQVTLILAFLRHLFTWIWDSLVSRSLDEICSFCISNHFLCLNVVNTLIKGEIVEIKLIWVLIWLWWVVDETLKWLWLHLGSSFMSFVNLACLFCFVSLWALWDFVRHFCSMRVVKLCEILYVSFALVPVVLSFYLFLRNRLLVRACTSLLFLCRLCWALPLLEEPAFGSSFRFAHDRCWALCVFSWGVMCFVSVVSSFYPCLWELRHFISRDLVSAFSLGFWISWMNFFYFFLF